MKLVLINERIKIDIQLIFYLKCQYLAYLLVLFHIMAPGLHFF